MARAEEARLARALETPVHRGDRYVAFGDLTVEDVRAQAAALREVGGWGPLARVAKVALAWSGLAGAMDRAGAARVAELDGGEVVTWGERTWVIPPPEGMI
jgi:hypothetical protein